MKVEFGLSCRSCDNRSACEIAGQKGKRLEEAAKNLGFTVTEGSVLCQGKEPRPEPWYPACGARVRPPDLATTQERQTITQLADLDNQAAQLVEQTKQLIQQTVGD